MVVGVLVAFGWVLCAGKASGQPIHLDHQDLLSWVQEVRGGEDGVEGLGQVLKIVGSPDGAHLDVVGSGAHAIVVFSRDGRSGELSYVETIRDGVDGVDGLSPIRGLAVSPDGAHVYATVWEGLFVFARDSTLGKLTWVEVLRDGVDGVVASRALVPRFSVPGVSMSTSPPAENIRSRCSNGTWLPERFRFSGLSLEPSASTVFSVLPS